MGPDDAQDFERDDDGDDEDRTPRRYSYTIDFDSVFGWLWLSVLTVLIFRCNGVSLW